METLLARLKNAVLALLALLVPGCSREPTLKWVLDGRVEVPAAEREALRTLFAGTRSSEVAVAGSEGLLGGFGGLGVRVEDGCVVGLATRDDVPVEPLADLPQLRRLVMYRSAIRDLEGLGPWPHLEELQLEFASLSSLAGIEECCPRLGRLTLSHGPVVDLGPLGGLAELAALHLGHTALEDLSTAPELPSLKTLYLTSGPLRSLAGIEAFGRLEKLQIFGAKQLADLEGLASHSRLRELVLFQTGLTALSDPGPLPSLERIETSDNRIMSVRLANLPALREVEMHEADLLSVELSELPSLESVDLLGESSLFKDGGRLDRLVTGTLPKLEKLDLRRNHLRHLEGLAPQPVLRQIALDRNPFDGLAHFAKGFPALHHVSVQRTRVAELPAELTAAGVVVSHDPSEIEANMWEGVLREAFEKMKSSFVEELPAGGGSLTGHHSSCSLRAATFSTPRLGCTGSIEKLTGLVYLPLVEVDPLSPGGGQNHFPVRATIRTRKGVGRIYLKYELDIRGQAEALAAHTDRERPWFELGDGRDPEDVRKGYSFAEARPGKPDSTSGEAHVLVDRLVVWVEGLEGAESIEYVIESPYR